MSKEKFKVDFDNLKPVEVEYTKGKFKTFTNASVLESDFQPYLGKPIMINVDKIISIYPSEDEIGTTIFGKDGNIWKVLEEFKIVEKRVNE